MLELINPEGKRLNLFAQKQPLTQETLSWVDQGFNLFENILGRSRITDCEVVLPNGHFFPDPSDGEIEAVRTMARRIATYMRIDDKCFEVSLYVTSTRTLRRDLPVWSGDHCDAAGLYFQKLVEWKYTIGINADKLADPIGPAAILAHELAHVILLGGGLLEDIAEDLEPLTDLATVYLGLGVLTSSASFQFRQWTSTSTQGWSAQSLGYLPEPVWGYALAYFARERGEIRPAWTKSLAPNIRDYYQPAERWLQRQYRAKA